MLGCCLLVVIGCTRVNGQTERNTGNFFGLLNLERHQFTFNLLGPGLNYEIGIIKNVSASGGLGLGYATYEEGFAVGLTLHTRLRYYHNFNRRLGKGKNVSGNSGNYLAAARSLFFSQVRVGTNIEGPDDFNLGFYGATYGLQRTFENGFNLNAEIGGGYYLGDGVPNGYGPLLNVTFGWVATNRKSRKPSFD